MPPYCSFIDYKYISLQLDKYTDIITLIVSILIFIGFIIALNLFLSFHIYRLICKCILNYLPSSISLFLYLSVYSYLCLSSGFFLYLLYQFIHVYNFFQGVYVIFVLFISFTSYPPVYSYIYLPIILALPRITAYTPEFLYYWHCENIIVRNHSQ